MYGSTPGLLYSALQVLPQTYRVVATQFYSDREKEFENHTGESYPRGEYRDGGNG